MDSVRELIFDVDGKGQLALPSRCSVDVSCLPDPEIQQAVALALEGNLYVAAYAGIDLTALDGITVAQDCRAAACALQNLPAGTVPLEVGPQPESMELARTAAVRRDGELRFHIVVRPGLGLMSLSPDKEMQRLVQACIAHEAAHVEHESHLYRTFPDSYGKPLDCGDRARCAFIKAMDVWSEYAACRSSAEFRPEAGEEYENILSRAAEESYRKATELIAAHREGRDAALVFREIQQIFGDVFVCAGYLLGHIHGLERNLRKQVFSQGPTAHLESRVTGLFFRLEQVLSGLWLTEYAWTSIEVFAPVYDLLCEMMALHGLVFARNGDEWRIVMCEQEHSQSEMQDALARWAAQPGRLSS